MNLGSFLNEPLFWVVVFGVVAGLVAMYVIVRQALVDAHFEIKQREDQQRGGGRRL